MPKAKGSPKRASSKPPSSKPPSSKPARKQKRVAETAPKRTQSKRGRATSSRSSPTHSSRSPARSTSSQRSVSRNRATPVHQRVIVTPRLPPILSPEGVSPSLLSSPRLLASRVLGSFSEVRKRAAHATNWFTPRRHPGFSSSQAAAYSGTGLYYAARVRRESCLTRLGHRLRAVCAALFKRWVLLLALAMVIAGVACSFVPNRQVYQRSLVDWVQQLPAPSQCLAALPDTYRDWRLVLPAFVGLSVLVAALVYLYFVCARRSRRRR